MKTLFLIFFLPILMLHVARAQHLISPATVSTAVSDNAQFSWSIGELQTMTLTAGNTKFTQGQQQPQTTVLLVNDIVVYNGLTVNDFNYTNNTFGIKDLEKYPNNKLVIVNRWGETLFSAAPYTANNLWAGKAANGNYVESGTYYYVFYPNVDVKQNFKGYILILKP